MSARKDSKDIYEELFQRNIGIYTPELQNLLRRSCIAIGGVGGPGGIAAVTLARNGIGHIKIADPDVFEKHNINRQYGALMSTLGAKKVDVIESILKDINPQLLVEKYPTGVKKNTINDFLTNADVVIDAIDYCAPTDKLRLYKTARDRGLYVLSTPCAGLGTLVMCFDPKGTTMEEAFAFPSDTAKIDEHDIPLERLIGCDLDYVSDAFFRTMNQDSPYISTNGSSCAVSAGSVSVDILKILILREREKDPGAFAYLSQIPLIVMPLARRIDLWNASKDGIVDILQLDNNDR